MAAWLNAHEITEENCLIFHFVLVCYQKKIFFYYFPFVNKEKKLFDEILSTESVSFELTAANLFHISFPLFRLFGHINVNQISHHLGLI